MAMTRCVSTAAARLRGGTLRASRAWHSTTSGGGMNETEYRTGTASSAAACVLYDVHDKRSLVAEIGSNTKVYMGPNFSRNGEVFCWAPRAVRGDRGLIGGWSVTLEELATVAATLHIMARSGEAGQPRCVTRSLQVTQVRDVQAEAEQGEGRSKELFIRAFAQHCYLPSRTATILTELCDPTYVLPDGVSSPQPLLRAVAGVTVLEQEEDFASCTGSNGISGVCLGMGGGLRGSEEFHRGLFQQAARSDNAVLDDLMRCYKEFVDDKTAQNGMRLLGTKILKYLMALWSYETFSAADEGRLSLIQRKAWNHTQQSLFAKRWLLGFSTSDVSDRDMEEYIESPEGRENPYSNLKDSDLRFVSQCLLAIMTVGHVVPAGTAFHCHRVVDLDRAAAVLSKHHLQYQTKSVQMNDRDLLYHFCTIVKARSEHLPDGHTKTSELDFDGNTITLGEDSGHHASNLTKFPSEKEAHDSLVIEMVRRVFSYHYSWSHTLCCQPEEEGFSAQVVFQESTNPDDDLRQFVEKYTDFGAMGTPEITEELAMHAARCAFLESVFDRGNTPSNLRKAFERSQGGEAEPDTAAGQAELSPVAQLTVKREMFKQFKKELRGDQVAEDGFRPLADLFAEPAIEAAVRRLGYDEQGLRKFIIENDFLERISFSEMPGSAEGARRYNVRALYNHRVTCRAAALIQNDDIFEPVSNNTLLEVGKFWLGIRTIPDFCQKGLEVSPNFSTVIVPCEPGTGEMERNAMRLDVDKSSSDRWVEISAEYLIRHALKVRRLVDSMMRRIPLYILVHAENAEGNSSVWFPPELPTNVFYVKTGVVEALTVEGAAEERQQRAEVHADNKEREGQKAQEKEARQSLSACKKAMKAFATSDSSDPLLLNLATQDSAMVEALEQHALEHLLRVVKKVQHGPPPRTEIVLAKGIIEDFCKAVLEGGQSLNGSLAFDNTENAKRALRSSRQARDLNLIVEESGLPDDRERQEFLGDGVLDLSAAFDCFFADRLHYSEQGTCVWRSHITYFQKTTENGHKESEDSNDEPFGLLPVMLGILNKTRLDLPLQKKEFGDILESLMGGISLDRGLGLPVAHERMRYLSGAYCVESNLYHKSHSHAVLWQGPPAERPPVFNLTRKESEWYALQQRSTAEPSRVQQADRGRQRIRAAPHTMINNILQGMAKAGKKEAGSTHFKFEGQSTSYVRAETASEVYHRMIHYHKMGVVGYSNERLTHITKVAFDLDGIAADGVFFNNVAGYEGWSLTEVIHSLVASVFPESCTTSVLLDSTRPDKDSQHLHWPSLTITLQEMLALATYVQDELFALDKRQRQHDNPDTWLRLVEDDKQRSADKLDQDNKKALAKKMRATEAQVYLREKWDDYVDKGVFTSRKLRMYLSDKCDEDMQRPANNRPKGCPVRQKKVLGTPPDPASRPTLISYFLDKHNSHPVNAVPIPHFDMLCMASLRHPSNIMDYQHSFEPPVNLGYWAPASACAVKHVDLSQADTPGGLDIGSLEVPKELRLDSVSAWIIPSSNLLEEVADEEELWEKMYGSSEVLRFFKLKKHCKEGNKEYYHLELWHWGVHIATVERAKGSDAEARLKVEIIKYAEPVLAELMAQNDPAFQQLSAEPTIDGCRVGTAVVAASSNAKNKKKGAVARPAKQVKKIGDVNLDNFFDDSNSEDSSPTPAPSVAAPIPPVAAEPPVPVAPPPTPIPAAQSPSAAEPPAAALREKPSEISEPLAAVASPPPPPPAPAEPAVPAQPVVAPPSQPTVSEASPPAAEPPVDAQPSVAKPRVASPPPSAASEPSVAAPILPVASPVPEPAPVEAEPRPEAPVTPAAPVASPGNGADGQDPPATPPPAAAPDSPSSAGNVASSAAGDPCTPSSDTSEASDEPLLEPLSLLPRTPVPDEGAALPSRMGPAARYWRAVGSTLWDDSGASTALVVPFGACAVRAIQGAVEQYGTEAGPVCVMVESKGVFPAMQDALAAALAELGGRYVCWSRDDAQNCGMQPFSCFIFLAEPDGMGNLMPTEICTVGVPKAVFLPAVCAMESQAALEEFVRWRFVSHHSLELGFGGFRVRGPADCRLPRLDVRLVVIHTQHPQHPQQKKAVRDVRTKLLREWIMECPKLRHAFEEIDVESASAGELLSYRRQNIARFDLATSRWCDTGERVANDAFVVFRESEGMALVLLPERPTVPRVQLVAKSMEDIPSLQSKLQNLVQTRHGDFWRWSYGQPTCADKRFNKGRFRSSNAAVLHLSGGEAVTPDALHGVFASVHTEQAEPAPITILAHNSDRQVTSTYLSGIPSVFRSLEYLHPYMTL